MEAFGNDMFVDSKKAKDLVESIEIPDARFDKFREYVSVKQ